MNAHRRVLVVGSNPNAARIAGVIRRAGHRVDVLDWNDVPLANDPDHSEALRTIDVIVDATIDALDPKRRVLQHLQAHCADSAVFITATDSSPASAVSENCQDPSRVVGARWSPSTAGAQLIELSPSSHTSADVLAAAEAFLTSCGLRVVVCKQDRPGHISIRLQMAMNVEALRLLAEGVATVEDVDRVAEGMYHHAHGPFQAIDQVGLAETLRIARNLAGHYQDDRFDAPALPGDVADFTSSSS